jgi:hypothetical protein
MRKPLLKGSSISGNKKGLISKWVHKLLSWIARRRHYKGD